MVSAVNLDHRLHRLPFAVQTFAAERNGFRRTRTNGVGIGLFSSHFHTVSVAYQTVEVFDASQRFDKFWLGMESVIY